MKKIEKCTLCGSELQPAGSTGNDLKIDALCPKCNILYFEGEAVAFQGKNIITKL